MWGIDVCTCLPSFHKTPLLDHVHPKLDAVWSQVPAEVQSRCRRLRVRCGAAIILHQLGVDAERVVEGPVRRTNGATARRARHRQRRALGLQLTPPTAGALRGGDLLLHLWDLVEPQ